MGVTLIFYFRELGNLTKLPQPSFPTGSHIKAPNVIGRSDAGIIPHNFP